VLVLPCLLQVDFTAGGGDYSGCCARVHSAGLAKILEVLGAPQSAPCFLINRSNTVERTFTYLDVGGPVWHDHSSLTPMQPFSITVSTKVLLSHGMPTQHGSFPIPTRNLRIE
jgi:hypothetical protein